MAETKKRVDPLPHMVVPRPIGAKQAVYGAADMKTALEINTWMQEKQSAAEASAEEVEVPTTEAEAAPKKEASTAKEPDSVYDKE